MTIMNTVSRSMALALAFAGGAVFAESSDLDTRLMLATVKIANPDSTGTGFVMSRPAPGPEDSQPPKPQFLLVTAEHVLSRMKGDEATVHFRRGDPQKGYTRSPVKVPIRQKGKNLWARHPAVDVAVIEVSPPPDLNPSAISVDLLASDADLARYEVHVGDVVKCIGFPHANQFESNESGFAVLRLGCLSSYPLLPTKKTKTFLSDLNTFEGDSGGPVFLAETHRFYAGKTGEGRVELILGLVSGQHFIDEEFRMVYQMGKFRHRMGLGIVVHASAIRETIDLLPRPRRLVGP